MEEGKLEDSEKKPRSKDKDPPKTQHTCDVRSRSRTPVTAVGGERSLATAPHRSPNLCIFLFQFICTSLVFNIFNLLNSFICFFCFCFCFCFNLLSCNKINVEVVVEKMTSCFRCNSRAQLSFFNFQFLASIKCLKSIQFHLKARLRRLIYVPKKKKYNHARYLEKWLMQEQLNYVARAVLHTSDNLVAKLLSSWGG